MNKYGNILNLEKGHGLIQSSKYYGGEERENSTGNVTYIAIGESYESFDHKRALVKCQSQSEVIK